MCGSVGGGFFKRNSSTRVASPSGVSTRAAHRSAHARPGCSTSQTGLWSTIAAGAEVMIAEPVERKIPNGLETRDHRLVNVSAASGMAVNSHHLSSGIQL
jgi:hypothetical protein